MPIAALLLQMRLPWPAIRAGAFANLLIVVTNALALASNPGQAHLPIAALLPQAKLCMSGVRPPKECPCGAQIVAACANAAHSLLLKRRSMQGLCPICANMFSPIQPFVAYVFAVILPVGS
ncbi:hypothetical protein, partial [Candidatus Magnetaquicoccus inordinatus]|uniref:hypothetical protein n=1 Tax=Candidatus Magnetaquicoccus inordinatus TaxID=2496818 RepID=UPI001D0E178B